LVWGLGVDHETSDGSKRSRGVGITAPSKVDGACNPIVKKKKRTGKGTSFFKLGEVSTKLGTPLAWYVASVGPLGSCEKD